MEHNCSRCGNLFHRDDLTAKRVTFTTMGNRHRLKKSRTVAWLCPDCLEKDEVWNRPAWTGPAPQQPQPAKTS